MEKLKVKVAYVYEGIRDPISEGVVIGDKVLTCVDDAYNLHNFEIDNDGVYVINLDFDHTDYLDRNRKLLLDLMVAQ
jgi:hypothetical protein